MTDKTPRAWDGALEQEFYTPEEIAASDARVGEAQLEIDREWIIEGLEFTLQESGWDANVAYDQELMIQVVTEAIALLKAQEPRVMTSNEVMDYVGYFDKNPPSEATKLPLWTESKEGTGVFSGYRNVGNIRNLIQMSGLDRGYVFNRHWRCWIGRPAQEQMEATPWE